MADPPMTDDDAPATRRDLRELRLELSAEFRQELAKVPTREEMRQAIAEAMNFVVGRMEEMEKRLTVEIARSARAGAEEHRREVGVIDEKYRDLPGRVAVLERDLDAHRRDTGVHARPKRPRR